MVLRFMDNKKDDKYYIKKATAEINAIIDYTKGMSYDEFMSNLVIIDAVMFRLIQLIENIKNISTSYKDDHLEIPWGKIMGFRNGIVHEYGETDYSIVYEVVSNDIYQLKEFFEKE